MADSQIAGLFMTPEMYQQEQNNQAFNRAATLAKMDPFEAAKTSLGYGGYQLAGALAGALGGQDPMLQRLTAQQQVMKNVDYGNPDSIKTAIQTLLDSGNTAAAHSLYQEALKNELTQSQITKNLREGRAAQTKLSEIGVAEGTREPVYSYLVPDGKGGVTAQQVIFKTVDGKQQMVPFSGGVDRTTSRTNMNVKLPEGESEFVKRLGTLDAQRVDAALTARDSAIQQLEIADRLAKSSPEALSGQFANTRAGMVNFLDTIGLTSAKDKQKLLKSQELTADSSRLVLAALNNKLGGGVSNQDAQRISEIFPQLENSPAARKELIDIIVRSANKTIGEVNNMEQYARKNRGLSGYVPTIPLVRSSGTNPASGMTDEQLKAIAGIK